MRASSSLEAATRSTSTTRTCACTSSSRGCTRARRARCVRGAAPSPARLRVSAPARQREWGFPARPRAVHDSTLRLDRPRSRWRAVSRTADLHQRPVQVGQRPLQHQGHVGEGEERHQEVRVAPPRWPAGAGVRHRPYQQRPVPLNARRSSRSRPCPAAVRSLAQTPARALPRVSIARCCVRYRDLVHTARVDARVSAAVRPGPRRRSPGPAAVRETV